MKNPAHKIIFEGAELTGKSYLMSQIYNHLEPKYNSGGKLLDGCHWFNLDVGVYGGPHGQAIVENYLAIIQELKNSNVLLEKFFHTDQVYQKLYHNKDISYRQVENALAKLGAKVILITYDEDRLLVKKRLADRLRLYPHYKKIAQRPEDYFAQQRLYIKYITEGQLPFLIVNATKLPSPGLVNEILHFIAEK